MKLLSLMALLSLAACGVNSASETASQADVQTLPAGGILKAARKIVPQTGPAYSITGVLSCSIVSQEVPPYSSESSCEIAVNEKSQALTKKDTQQLITELKKLKPQTGPAYFIKVDFKASSISSEVPPYGAQENLEVVTIH